MLSSLPINTCDLLLVAINILAIYIAQIILFTYVGSKTNLNVINELLISVRLMVLNLTYNKIDINDYINLTIEEQNSLKSLKKTRDDYNSSLLFPLYNIIGGLFLFTLFMFFTFPDTSNPRRGNTYLRNTFLTKTNISLIVITLALFSTELYLFFRFIKKVQLITAFDILEDPLLFEQKLKKYKCTSLYDIYNDNEIQIIHEINKYINKSAILKKNKPLLVDKILNKFKSDIELDEQTQNLLIERSKYAAQIDILKQNTKLINNRDDFDKFNTELKKIESLKSLVTDNINDTVKHKIKTISFDEYNKFIKN